MSKQERADAGGRPWCIQYELVTGCSMRHGSGPGGLCHFCGLTAIRNGPGQYEYMPMELVDRISQQVAEFCPTARIEFAMRGEPLMHPKSVEIVALVRSYLPSTSIMITTNGDTLRGHLQKRVEKLFVAGCNLLLIDTYYPKERRDELRAEALALKNIPVIDFFEDWAGEGKSPYARQHPKSHIVVLMDDLAVRDGEHSSRQVKTHAGANMTKSITEPLHRNCGRPFRELVIHADGNVPLCCDDWQQAYSIGNVRDYTLQELWCHPRMEAARARLMQKDRGFGPCAQCDAPMAPRTGLLPAYDLPTPEQMALTEETTTRRVPIWKLTQV